MNRYKVTLSLYTVAILLVFNAWTADCAEPLVVSNAGQKTGITDTAIVLGSCLPLGSFLKDRCQELLGGANAYFSSVNDAGGVNGRKIELESHDDQYDPEKAIVCFNTNLKNKSFAGFLFLGSAAIAKYVRMGEVANMPMLGYMTGTPVAYTYHPTQFTANPSLADEVHAMIENMCGEHGIKRVAVIYQNDAFGAAIRENTVKSLSQYHLTPTVESSYSRTGAELEDAFGRVLKSDPQAVILGATGERLTALVTRRKIEKIKPLFVGLSMATDYLHDMGHDADGVVLTQLMPSLKENLPAIALYNKLRKKYAPNAKPTMGGLQGMVNAMVAVEALKRAGKELTRDKFCTTLEAMNDFDLGLGPNYHVHFSPTNHNGLSAKAVYLSVVRNGEPQRLSEADWKSIPLPQ